MKKKKKDKKDVRENHSEDWWLLMHLYLLLMVGYPGVASLVTGMEI